MDLHGINPNKLVFLFLTPFLSIQLTNALVSTFVYSFCISGTYDPYDENLHSINSVLSDLTHHSSNSTFYSSNTNTTYGLFYCTANVDPQDCHACVKSASNDTQTYCPSYKAAVVYYQECTVRFQDSPVSGIDDESVSAWSYSEVPVSYKQFNNTLYSTLNTVITQAAYGAGSKGFASVGARLVGAKRERLYAFAQCTPDILGSGCQNCLQVALEQLGSCCGANDTLSVGPLRSFIMTFNPSCQLRHDVRNSSDDGIIPFSSSSSSDPPGTLMYAKLFALAVAAVLSVALR